VLIECRIDRHRTRLPPFRVEKLFGREPFEHGHRFSTAGVLPGGDRDRAEPFAASSSGEPARLGLVDVRIR